MTRQRQAQVCKGLLLLATLLGFILLLPGQSRPSQTVDFGHVSDTHIMKLSGVAPPIVNARARFESSGTNFVRFLQMVVKKYHPQFVLHSGDIVDGYSFQGAAGAAVYGQIEYFQLLVRQSPLPLMLSLGNHDVTAYRVGPKGGVAGDQAVAGEARAAWIRSAECFRKGTYYSFEKQAGATKYLFLVLENGYYGGSLGAQPEGRKRTQRLDHAQLYWLRKQLEAHPGAIPILVMHVPLAGDEMSAQIKEVLSVSTTAKTTLALVGHLHTSDTIEDLDRGGGNKIVQVFTKSFTENEKSWRRIRLTESNVWISRVDDPETAQRLVDIAPSEARGGRPKAAASSGTASGAANR